MLKKLRVTLAVSFITLITILFLDISGVLHHYLGWIAKIQFWPSLLALNVVVIIAVLLLTLLFGRVYCSVICPLGVLQDISSHLAGRFRKYRFRYTAESRIRYIILLVFVIASFVCAPLVALLEPYSTYGLIVSQLLSVPYEWCNNLLATWAERHDSYLFYSVDVWFKGMLPLVTAIVMLIVVVGLSAWRGRWFCNTICPVGTMLSLFSRFSLFAPTFDHSKCNKCSLCARSCKSQCIDVANQRIDYSRCVSCMDCVATCRKGAMIFSRRAPQSSGEKSADRVASTDSSRRTFLTATLATAATAVVKAQISKVDGGMAVIEDKIIPQRAQVILPPGSISFGNMLHRCLSCQLCIQQCPNDVLRPSSQLERLMQPEVQYDRGYCRPECNRCSQVCPTGAIQPLSVAERSSTQVGHAVWIKANCIVTANDQECGNCARHCPVGAIQMVPMDADDEMSLLIPAVNVERCIGCGACENLCPSRPLSAIYVEGHEMQKTV